MKTSVRITFVLQTVSLYLLKEYLYHCIDTEISKQRFKKNDYFIDLPIVCEPLCIILAKSILVGNNIINFHSKLNYIFVGDDKL